MKVICERCKKDLTAEVNNVFSRNKVGNIECPYCGKKQKRYVSKADLLLYQTYQEAMYLVIMVILSNVIVRTKPNTYSLIVLGVMFVGVIVLTAFVKNKIYTNGYLKEETMYKGQNEDDKKIQKSIMLQTVIYFVLMLAYLMIGTYNLPLLLIFIAMIISTFIRAKIAAKNEY